MVEKRVQRRLAAIFAADMVGYTRLMEADEEGTIARQKAHRKALIDPKIAEHDGRIVKTTGDGMLVEFASVVDAVRCAVEVQEAMAQREADVPDDRRIRYRVGVNLGDIVIDGDDILGDGVNVAARLEGLAEPGGISISAKVHAEVKGKIDVGFEDMGAQAVKNIAEPVHVYRVITDSKAVRGAPRGRTARFGRHGRARRKKQWLVSTIVGAAIIFATVGAWLAVDRVVGPVKPVTGGTLPIIAVLPFANRSGDADQDYFADGVTEELINALGRFNTLRVIGRNAVLPFKKRPASRSDITSKLGANYLVEGSVFPAGRRVRIAVRLIDARAGTVLWTERYDGELADIFQFQDAIARQIAGRLAVNVTQIEGRRRRAQPNPKLDAYDVVLRARAMGNVSTCRTNRRYREMLSKAVKLDQGYALAHALLAEAIFTRVVLGCTEFRNSELSRGKTHARRAIELAPGEPDGHRALGRLHLLRSEYDSAQIALRRAIEINPSDSYALAEWGRVQLYAGDIAGAIKSLKLALKYNPALEALHLFDLSLSYYLARRHADALRIAEQTLSRLPNLTSAKMVAAAAAARLGRRELALRYVGEVRQRLPYLKLQKLGSRLRVESHRAYLREGLKLAGLKDH